MGLVLKTVRDDGPDAEVEAMAARMMGVAINQPAMQKPAMPDGEAPCAQ